MSQQLRPCIAFGRDASTYPSTQVRKSTAACNSNSRGLDASISTCTHVHRLTYIHRIKTKIIKTYIDTYENATTLYAILKIILKENNILFYKHENIQAMFW